MIDRFNGAVLWILGGLLALGLLAEAKDKGMLSGVPGLGAVPWEHIDATSFKQDCLEEGEASYAAIGEKDGQVLSFERPCSDPPPENLR